MTGLDPKTDTVLSVACFITNASLELLDQDGYEAVIHHSAASLAGMNEWCVRTHTDSGLVDQCTASTTTAETAATEMLDYIKRHVPDQRTALLAGNSVHADKMFLMVPPWDKVLEWLHYRILDVSAIKEGVRRWSGDDVLQGVPRKLLRHEAKADILESIDEARYYQGFFKQMRNAPMATSLKESTSMQSQDDSGALVNRLDLLGRTDSYGNTITAESARIELGAKRKAAEAGISAPLALPRAPSNGFDSNTIAFSGLTGNVGGDGDDGADMGFRTDVP